MPLQNIIITKINEFCGKQVFISTLKELKLICNQDEQETLDNTIMYYRLLFNMTIDYERDVINYHVLRQKVLDILIEKHKEYNIRYNDFLLFFKELIHYGDNYVTGIRKLIS
jgi:hypothetical protein